MHTLFEHKADMGIRGTGLTREKAFEEAAEAMLTVMAEPGSILEKEKYEIRAEADSIENLLVEFLNEVLYMMDCKEAVFRRVNVKGIRENRGKFLLDAEALGEKKSKKHKFKTEVKAASYSQLKAGKENGKWVAQCIVDV